MAVVHAPSWRTGNQVAVRGRRWTIAGVTHATDCSALRLTAIDGWRQARDFTILVPFDRPRSLEHRRAPRVVRPRRWLHELDRALIHLHPFGSLRAAARTPIRLVPYQLEPALAVLRDGATRVLIADAVGLGKTIQAGLVLLELSSRLEAFRALVLVPAGLRDQWQAELSAHFTLAAVCADASWLRSTRAERPADVNPWSLPGIYIASHDFVKRPEVLRPLEDVTWDLLVIDEAHLATAGTDRRHSAHALALRSRRVILLTATPHAGNSIEFDALCCIGRADGGEGPVLLFQRSRSEVGAGRPRKSTVLSIMPSEAERRMHHLLDRYSKQVWDEAGERGDDRARLASIVLRKRALSSAGSLAASVQRRLQLLTDRAQPEAWQLGLPLADEDPLEDDEPLAALAAPGLADPKRERRWLATIAEAARLAARAETKARFLLRLLARLREPVIVFTEYRDTLSRLERQIAASGRSLAILHGGMALADRGRAQRAFNERGGTLLATDAAAEGLNLHHQCRIVVHYELPWNPSRLEQRAGRVDRLGQSRRVHEIALVAADTAERLVIAPLAARLARARRRTMAGGVRMLDALTESRVADFVMSGADTGVPEIESSYAVPSCAIVSATDLRLNAEQEAARLEHHRRLLARSCRGREPAHQHGPLVSSLERSSHVPRGLFLMFVIAVSNAHGHRIHSEPILLHVDLGMDVPTRADPERLREFIRTLVTPTDPTLFTLVAEAANERLSAVIAIEEQTRDGLSRREESIARAHGSAARHLVQPGLFDRRSLREAASRARTCAALEKETGERVIGLRNASPLLHDTELVAALLVSSRPPGR